MEIDKLKKILQDVLDGNTRPGDEAWERVWDDDELHAVRFALLELGEIRPEELVTRRDEIWRRIERARVSRERRAHWRRMRRVAAVLLPLAVAGVWWWLGERRVDPVEVVREVLAVTNNRAVLVLDDGERVELSSVAGDTVWQRDGATVTLDASRVVSYQSDHRQQAPRFNTMIVPRTGEYELLLDDGSRVILNSESELRFPVSFTREERRVFLKGEGYFEVARNEGRPFIVTAGGVDLRVLGTAFNVNTHDPEGRVLATLVSGSLGVSTTGDDARVLLRPGQQAIASGEGIVARDVDVALYTSWVHGRFAFEGATLGEITGQLERWYDVRFRFADEGLDGLLFTGMFKREYTIERAISIIARTTRVKFDKDGDTITVSR
ncbi:MAG: DUF4974 domain-containing protein [Odoribacteraceae bacterium]|jgi:ferric-dicitrate binding protein FerR (iron transport regulator)|nr:DUF4974 domain-containing protein [Odoribacteraceae bacterium]